MWQLGRQLTLEWNKCRGLLAVGTAVYQLCPSFLNSKVIVA